MLMISNAGLRDVHFYFHLFLRIAKLAQRQKY